ncbi:hypothetical protein G6011_10301 [Alternaria panax]|uniref:Uncharacterized protein n=1 Tax=Alternaria panax TaxID=48097 RepID=A0AAD4IBQ2_9PLEO|nr:hypothetical protein G6011_10301 [Alternaria panax]
MTSSIAQNVPAAMLFSPEDVRQFARWQKEHCLSFLPGFVGDYMGYHKFLDYQGGNEQVMNVERDKERSLHRNPAVRCGHELHPSDIAAAGYCPVCEVYATSVKAEFDALVTDSSPRPPGCNQRILGLHPGIQPISEFVNRFLQGTATARSEMLEMISVADALIVLVGDEDIVLDMHFSVSDDVEVEGGYGDEDVDQTRWTCWAECGNEAMPAATSATGLWASFVTDDEERMRKHRKTAECDSITSEPV